MKYVSSRTKLDLASRPKNEPVMVFDVHGSAAYASDVLGRFSRSRLEAST